MAADRFNQPYWDRLQPREMKMNIGAAFGVQASWDVAKTIRKPWAQASGLLSGIENALEISLRTTPRRRWSRFLWDRKI